MFPRHFYGKLYGLERRHLQRYPVPFPTPVTLVAGGRDYDGMIEDVSLGGARIRFDGPVALDGAVEVVHSTVGRLGGRARWHSGSVSGLSFDDTEAAVGLCVHCLKKMVPKGRPG
jgi:hypothetical protein